MAKQPKVSGTILERIQANSRIKETAILTESKLYEDRDAVATGIPIMNVALSGDLDVGYTSGLIMFAGPSKHFKTLFTMLLASYYMKKYPDAVMLFYTSEFGSPITYFDSLHIDKDRVVISPILDIEELKFDLMKQLNGLVKGDKVIIVVDSIGNLASVKEVSDAEEANSVTDMSRAKALKSFFRVIAPRCTMKDIPFLVVNHVYQEQKLYGATIVSGGTGSYYNSDTIFIIGRQQDAEGKGAEKEIKGYRYVINVEKSRYVKEKSKFILEVGFDTGINKWSGLLDVAEESGHVIKPKMGKYQRAMDGEEGQLFSEDETNTKVFWAPILADISFKEYIRNTYQLAESELMTEEEC
jgi:hypothetical protein